ncbi:MAG: dihydropteroate synthase [Parachlamydiaceae bacterium]|nr:dihydropteroate synthase [Parachlamydiaceae bacterium]
MSKTKIMGIINVTPDSFYNKSRYITLNEAVDIALKMKEDGADILDIGGESSRPGAAIVSEDEELKRVIPVIEAISQVVDLPISIDTTKPNVARAAIKAGATLLNDITGFDNQEMIDLAREFNLDICVMHMQGKPQTMQKNPLYAEGITAHLLHWFKIKSDYLIGCGINPKKIILDPGIGFGKTVADNLEIVHNLRQLKQLGFAVLLGVSRKSFLSTILNKPTTELLPATLAINTIAIASQVDIIRVHDVKEHRDIVNVLSKLIEDRR